VSQDSGRNLEPDACLRSDSAGSSCAADQGKSGTAKRRSGYVYLLEYLYIGLSSRMFCSLSNTRFILGIPPLSRAVWFLLQHRGLGTGAMSTLQSTLASPFSIISDSTGEIHHVWVYIHYLLLINSAYSPLVTLVLL